MLTIDIPADAERRMQVVEAAIICHEANRAYCGTLGDHSQVAWQDAPQWQCESAIKGVKLHLADLRAGVEPLPSRSHESWLAEKREAGWKYGPVKDAEAKTHPCFIPFEGLPPEQQAKDYLFIGVVRALYEAGRL